MEMYGEHRFPAGFLSSKASTARAKATQLSLLASWLKAEGYGVVFSDGTHRPVVKDTTKRGEKKKMLTPRPSA